MKPMHILSHGKQEEIKKDMDKKFHISMRSQLILNLSRSLACHRHSL